MRKSLGKARLKYPLTGARIDQDASGTTRFVLDNVPEFQVRVLDKKNDSEWLDLAWDEQKKPFDLNRGPLIKFLLLSSADTSDLVVICHHCICDGLSLAYLIRDIALFLSEPDVEVEALPLLPGVSVENLSGEVVPSWLERTVINRMNR